MQTSAALVLSAAALCSAADPACIAEKCPIQSLHCATDLKCRGALGCLIEECTPPCKVDNVRKCDPSQCMLVNNGTECGPSPKCTLQCFDTHTQYSNAPFNNLVECMYSSDCAPQMVGDWPKEATCVPPRASVGNVTHFEMSMLEGRWFITRGLSDEFDTYPCQVACNRVVAPHRVNLSIWYQIPMNDGSQLQQVSHQSFFAPDPAEPGHLRQHAWMDGQDDWYVIAARPGKYWLVRYCGCNETWCGYGGAFLYTRTPTFDDPALEEELRRVAQQAGFDYNQMKKTNNTNCGIEPTPHFGCPALL